MYLPTPLMLRESMIFVTDMYKNQFQVISSVLMKRGLSWEIIIDM
jgi:hypothetical protein